MVSVPLLVNREGLAKLVPQMKVGLRGIGHCKVSYPSKIALEANEPSKSCWPRRESTD